ncbi:glycoside hydrolase family 31 [Streptomyces sp. AJS327]|uniref:glycoside hydrolase family 31 protein n=1 Tax=Streptomyces sp. AJS327 TaxID=2545265 RepID=UPI0015DD8DB3|nr:TIM-barrel domain-containing protein [Streptomyces sp. AJS327]MBA0053222.1 glycoside hydrolase family 31 [Streptomyces sp. AJS327]
MIRHRPHGSGHAYQPTDDQRVPATPHAGEPFELRASTGPDVTTVVCAWEHDGTVTELPATIETSDTEGDVGGAGDSHLAAAASGAGRGRHRWVVRPTPLPAGGSARYRFTATHSDGRTRSTRWHTVAPATWREGAPALTLSGPAADRYLPGSARTLTAADGRALRVRFALTLTAAEHVVGFGERYHAVDQRGGTLDAQVFEQYKGQGHTTRTYLPMPFAFVIAGQGADWGFHVRTSRRTWYDVAATDHDLLWIEAEVGPDGALDTRGHPGAPHEVLGAFLDDVGRPEELPDWVFGLWASGNEWNTQARVMAEMDRHRDTDIPVRALVIEAWSDESTFTAFRDAQYPVHEDGAPHQLADFTFPADGAWPDPRGMVDTLHARGIKVLLWQIPLMKTRPHPTGQAAADARTMVERDYAVRESDGARPYRNRGWWFPLALMPDLTNPEARDWWLAKRRYLVDEIGVDGFKTDGGEHAWGADLRYADGTHGDETNNLFPVQYPRAYGQLLRDSGKAPVTFSRAGFTGSQTAGAFWAGDEDSTWDAYRHSITAGITASACGIVYWGWDLAGFSGDVPSAELFIRATEFSTFVPVMQYHSEYNHHRQPRRDRTPWNIAERTGDPTVLDTFRRYAQLRERLIPYLATETRTGLAENKPLMRGLFFEYPDDPRVWDHQDHYLLGSALLVAPVTEPGATHRTVFLPTGEWTDVWTGEQITGGRVREHPAPLGTLPVFAKADRWPTLKPLFSETT